MGYRRRTQDGRGLSPWTVLSILACRAAGESTSALNQRFAVSRSTITRWMEKWGHEAGIVSAVKQGVRSRVSAAHKEVMAVADAAQRIHKLVLAMHAAKGRGRANPDVGDLLDLCRHLDDHVRALEGSILGQFSFAAELARHGPPAD